MRKLCIVSLLLVIAVVSVFAWPAQGPPNGNAGTFITSMNVSSPACHYEWQSRSFENTYVTVGLGALFNSNSRPVYTQSVRTIVIGQYTPFNSYVEPVHAPTLRLRL